MCWSTERFPCGTATGPTPIRGASFGQTDLRTRQACAKVTSRSVDSFTASSLTPRLNFQPCYARSADQLSGLCLRFHGTGGRPRLLAEHYSPQRDYKPKEVADSNDFTRQAQKNVRKRQEERVAWIDRSEKNQVERLHGQSRDTLFRDMSFERPAQERTEVRERDGLTREFRRSR